MTSRHSSDSKTLKSASRQGVHVSQQRREAILDEFERSGMSAAAFAKRHGIKYSTFAGWSLKRRKQGRPTDGIPKLAEVIIEQVAPTLGDSSTSLRVHLPGGAWLEFDGNEAHSRLAVQFIKSLQA